MPSKTGASPFLRSRVVRFSRSSSLTRRVRKRSSEKALRRRSPNVRGTLMKENPHELQRGDYTPLSPSGFEGLGSVKLFYLRSVAQCRFHSANVLLALCICFFGTFARSQVQRPADLSSAGQIVDVTSASDAIQSYALYLPSTYTAAKR